MNEQKNPLTDFFGPVISSYSRAEAIEDGVLVDVTETAKEAGVKFPVALTRAVYEDCVAWGEKDNKSQAYQDESGRLWDVLWMFRMAARRADGDTIRFQLVRVPRDGKARTAHKVTLKAMLGPGDEGEPVVTIMQPNED